MLRQALVPFYRAENEVSERISNLTQVAQLVNARAGMPTNAAFPNVKKHNKTFV